MGWLAARLPLYIHDLPWTLATHTGPVTEFRGCKRSGFIIPTVSEGEESAGGGGGRPAGLG